MPFSKLRFCHRYKANGQRELCQKVEDSPQLPWVLRGLTAFYSVRAEHQVTYDLAKQCFDLATARQERIFLIGAHLELASALIYLGDFAQALQFLEKGATLYNSQEQDAHAFLYGQHFGVSCVVRMAEPLWYLGYPDQALKKSQEALVLARIQPHTFSLAYALSFATALHASRREWGITQGYAEEVITLSTEQGFPVWAAVGNMMQGWALAMQGQAKEGIVPICKGLDAWRETGAEVGRARFLALLVEAYLQLGLTEAGGRVLDEAFTVLNKSGERWWEAELYRVKGELLLAQKMPNTASQEIEVEQYFQKALDVSRFQSAKSFELRAAISLGQLWKQQGRGDDALRLLQGVYNWFTEGFETADLREAKGLIEKLS
jgi:predicted ATPase